MSHAKAKLTPAGRLLLVERIERDGWPPAHAAAMAGEKAIQSAGIDRSRIGIIVDSSVCRERLEPSSAVEVHDQLGLPSTCMNFDIGNACLGFLNGMHLAGSMLESGQIDYALIVDGEGTREIHENTINRILQPDSTIDDLFFNFASLTLGSGSAAMVMGRHSENPGSHPMTAAMAATPATAHGSQPALAVGAAAAG